MSKSDVFPVSTCPRTHIIGERKSRSRRRRSLSLFYLEFSATFGAAAFVTRFPFSSKSTSLSSSSQVFSVCYFKIYSSSRRFLKYSSFCSFMRRFLFSASSVSIIKSFEISSCVAPSPNIYIPSCCASKAASCSSNKRSSSASCSKRLCSASARSFSSARRLRSSASRYYLDCCSLRYTSLTFARNFFVVITGLASRTVGSAFFSISSSFSAFYSYYFSFSFALRYRSRSYCRSRWSSCCVCRRG